MNMRLFGTTAQAQQLLDRANHVEDEPSGVTALGDVKVETKATGNSVVPDNIAMTEFFPG